MCRLNTHADSVESSLADKKYLSHLKEDELGKFVKSRENLVDLGPVIRVHVNYKQHSLKQKVRDHRVRKGTQPDAADRSSIPRPAHYVPHQQSHVKLVL